MLNPPAIVITEIHITRPSSPTATTSATERRSTFWRDMSKIDWASKLQDDIYRPRGPNLNYPGPRNSSTGYSPPGSSPDTLNPNFSYSVPKYNSPKHSNAIYTITPSSSPPSYVSSPDNSHPKYWEPHQCPGPRDRRLDQVRPQAFPVYQLERLEPQLYTCDRFGPPYQFKQHHHFTSTGDIAKREWRSSQLESIYNGCTKELMNSSDPRGQYSAIWESFVLLGNSRLFSVDLGYEPCIFFGYQ